jgi:hypothetical protein
VCKSRKQSTLINTEEPRVTANQDVRPSLCSARVRMHCDYLNSAAAALPRGHGACEAEVQSTCDRIDAVKHEAPE